MQCGALGGGLGHAPLVVDVNSVSPATKRAAAERVAAMGGRYVEAAVMASFPPKRLRTPILLGGPHAADFMRAWRGSAWTSPISRPRSAAPPR